MCPTKMISQRNDAFYFEVHGFVFDLAEQSWTLEAEFYECSAGTDRVLCVT